MSGQNLLLVEELLGDLNGALQDLEGLDIRDIGIVANLVVALGKDTSADARLGCVSTARHVEKDRVRGALEVRGDREANVRGRHVAREGELSRRLDDLIAALGSHGERVLPSIDSHTKLHERIAKCDAGIPHLSTLPSEFSGVHPVSARLYVLDGRYLRPHNVGHCLCDGEARHLSGGNESLDGLLSDCDDRSGGGEVRVRDDAVVCEGDLQGSYARLLRDESRDGPVHLMDEEPLRSDRKVAEDASEDVLGRGSGWERKGDERVVGDMVVLEGLLRHLSEHEFKR
mmetsp:Transcript_6895/g.13752  ORF Transcript_6895/g.13752 Transcript_6895/m.13752 type:complete len:286 (-) Transcript_6895:1923-2780(-)